MEIIVVLHNIRSTYNVGAILRTCEGLGIERVVYSGYTPRYDDQSLLPHLREKLNRQIAKSALGAEKLVKQVYLSKNEVESELENALKNEEILGSGAENSESESENLKNCNLPLTKWLKCAIMEGYTRFGLENNLSRAEKQKRVILGQKVAEDGKKVDFGEKCVLILGEEVHGIPAEIRELCDYFLEIQMQGQKESFNVSIATGIALWGLENCY